LPSDPRHFQHRDDHIGDVLGFGLGRGDRGGDGFADKSHILGSQHRLRDVDIAELMQRRDDRLHRSEVGGREHGGTIRDVDIFNPPSRDTGELNYPISAWAHHLPGISQRWMEESQRKKVDQSAMRLWHINEVFFAASPHYLAASGAPVSGAFPGISMHTELEMLVRLGLTPREALAAATSNYAAQFNWNELGLIGVGRRADVLVLDGDPTVTVWNVRRIVNLILDGNVLDRDALLSLKK